MVPARAGSKGLAHKNVRPFLGKPLIAHSLGQARDAGVFDVVAASSDSAEYLEIARAAGADRLVARPAELATDTAGSMEVLRHAVAEVEADRGRRFDTVCLLQATSPLRTGAQIAAAVAQLEAGSLDSVVSVAPSKDSPYFNLVEPGPDGERVSISKPLPAAVLRRQDAPPVYRLNGSIYVWRRGALDAQRGALCDRTGIYVMPPLYSVDIDTAEDWAFAELAARLIADGADVPAQ